jgi:N-dimethylarginine dimethylaminohydrolase
MMFGVSSMTLPLKKVGVLKPSISLKTADTRKWHYSSAFDPKKIEKIHESFIQLLVDSDVEIFWMSENDRGIADAVFTYDASFMTGFGAILMSPGKVLRRGEQEIHRSFYENKNIPIIGEIKGGGIAEGGDMFWLDAKTLIVGRGFRTNQRGINQLTSILKPFEVDILAFDLPCFFGYEACLHMMSLISLVDKDKAIIHSPLLPVGLWQLLKEKKFLLIEAPHDEFHSSSTLSINVLATSPGECIMLSGLPKTSEALSKAGIKVRLFDGDALCIGCEGGPTCLTRPLLRE